jgi:hypothetical protein
MEQSLGERLCGKVWIEERREAECPDCELPLRIEEHFGKLCYSCVVCRTHTLALETPAPLLLPPVPMIQKKKKKF